CKDGGKAEVIRDLKLDGELIVIGDGYTDYEIKAAIPSAHFVAFTENVIRDVVVEKADHVVDSFSDVIYISDEPVRLSYPKNKIRVLLLEQVHPRAVEIFKEEGYQVESLAGSLDKEALCNKMHRVSILGIRSKTNLTSDVFKASKTLLAVGAFCIGTDQIDLLSASESGVSVINAPYSNTRSVVELALGEIIMLMRRAIDSSKALHEGKWQKSAKGCFEVRGKKLGIVGYGNIGSQLSVLAESLGMNVYYYDVVEKLSLGNAKKCKSLEELLKISDVVTLHVDGRASNAGLIGIREFNLMKDGVVFLNLSRGSVVDTNSLVQSLKSGKVAGAAVDVFQNEPRSNEEEFFSELRGLPNVILTPHIGGSTHEAQESIAEYVAEKIISYINTGNSVGSVNFPEIALSPVFGAHRLLHVHKNVPGILAEINGTLARFKINILGQYLKTTEQIGYVITDVNKEYNSELIDTLKSIPNTIRFRVLY
ncbi:MAG: phosphoglycerate dehydrogenase, partial [SAR324 cluster bacterium]|nr:phosphoglycerate dehydrogenase [SAR324 cluster bacterium]